MDYRKTNAPSNTVTRDMMKLSSDTGNVYETVAIIGKRANQIAVERKTANSIILQTKRNFRNLLPIMIIWKKFLKTESRLRFHVTMKNSQNRL